MCPSIGGAVLAACAFLLVTTTAARVSAQAPRASQPVAEAEAASRAPANGVTPPEAAKPSPAAAPMTMEAFLDRLMMAESGGRLDARNPRSTALGPYQFIESTFLAVARRHFGAETAGLAPAQILALRTDKAFSRKAAEAYTRDNAAVLESQGIKATYPNLRLAFLLGPNGAARVLSAAPETPLAGLLAPAVLVANPFMSRLTAAGLAARAAREVAQPVTASDGIEVLPGTVLPRRAAPPGITVRCNLRLPSCRRWLALHGAKARMGKPSTGPKLAALGTSPPVATAKASRRAARVSPTMEAAARGIPLSRSRVQSVTKGKALRLATRKR